MKEVVFISRNNERWKHFEQMLQEKKQQQPDLLADLFMQVTDDLSYARTFYPGSSVSRYLNDLALRAHLLIYRNKKEKKGRIATFWKTEFPVLFQNNVKFFYYSLAIFFVAILIGIVSTLYDDTFVRLILGDGYVNMTLANIDKGDPLAVYKQMNQADMFLGISINNIYVSFLAFVFGIIISVGTGYIIFNNGVMLGCFLTFFYQKGLLADAMSTIWIHGTLEIFAIIVAGGAGLMLGNSILFPGTYSRLHSFKSGVARGIKTVCGLIPVFIIAAFFEGFITRYTHMSYAVRICIIAASILLIVWYFFIYARSIQNKIFPAKPLSEQL
jgi:uncharacterized membrane protein SpoIIM required for sporulation